MVYGRINVIDIRYHQFEAQLTGTRNSVSTGADLTVLILNGVGATTGSSAAKTALAAASGGVIGAKSTVSTDLFYEKTMPALVAQMRANRQQALVKIETGLGQTVDEYSLGEALNDVQAYYAAGSLPSAVQEVTSQAGASLAEANKALTEARDRTFVEGRPAAEALLDRVTALTPTQALAVLTAMKVKLSERPAVTQTWIKSMLPRLDATTNGDDAKEILKRWVVLDGRSPDQQKQWTDALEAATH